MNNENRVRRARDITAAGFVVNLLLSAAKFAAGIAANSAAMVADATHSLSDLATDVVVLIGFRYVGKPVDKSHDYGHGKIETLVSVAVGMGLAAAAALIIILAARTAYLILTGGAAKVPGAVAIAAALLSIAVKEILYRKTIAVGREINSMAVVANAWHHRSDSLSSVAAAVGITGAVILGGKWLILDPLAAFAVGVLVMKVAYSIAVAGLKELLEESLCDEEEKKVMATAAAVPGVLNPHGVRSRKIGANVAVEIHIEVQADISVAGAHEISSAVEKKIGGMFEGETFVSVHVEPHFRT